MELIETPWHLFSAFLIFFGGAIIALKARKYFDLPYKRALLLYGWHTLWCLAYLRYSLDNVADATLYYENGARGNFSWAVGTDFVNLLAAVLAQYGGLSYLGCFLVFNIFGAIGLMAFDGALRTTTKNKTKTWRRIAALIVFLPSVSFWSAAIGKDAISFMAACLALWAALDLSRRYKLMIFAVTMMFLVRPHMAGLMVFGVIVSVILSRRGSVFKKIFLILSSVAVAAILTPFAIQYAGLGDTSMAGITEYMEQREGYNMEGGGAVDISSMSPPLRVATYLFRPFPYEAVSISQFAASMENVALLALFVVGLFRFFGRAKNKSIEGGYFMATYSLLSLLVLAMTTANLGIAVRQKWMFMPILILFLISIIGSESKKPRKINSSAMRQPAGYEQR